MLGRPSWLIKKILKKEKEKKKEEKNGGGMVGCGVHKRKNNVN